MAFLGWFKNGEDCCVKKQICLILFLAWRLQHNVVEYMAYQSFSLSGQLLSLHGLPKSVVTQRTADVRASVFALSTHA